MHYLEKNFIAYVNYPHSHCEIQILLIWNQVFLSSVWKSAHFLSKKKIVVDYKSSINFSTDLCLCMIPTKNQGSLQRSYAENAESRTQEKQNLEWKAVNNSIYLQASYTI